MGRKIRRSGVGTGVIQVNGYSTQWLRQGFDWVYAKEVIQRDPRLKAGDIVRLLGEKGTFQGLGVFDDHDPVVRRFRWDDGELDSTLFVQRLREALLRRVLPTETNAFRVLHGENDDTPGIRVDRWGDHLTLLLHSDSLRSLIPAWVSALETVFPGFPIWGHVRSSAGDNAPLGLLSGDGEESGIVTELGLRYVVRPSQSPDAGLFFDMRPLRQWLSHRWCGEDVLNLFCYTGAFSVSALSGGAKSVTSVDLSATYLNWLRENLALNGLNDPRHSCVESDAFKSLDRFRRKGEDFGVVILDPPSFSHSSAGNWSVQKDLRRLVVAGLRVLRPGGLLVVATNQGKMSPREFQKAIVEAGRKLDRRLVLLHQHSPPSDVPAALHFPESRYLKCWVIQG